MHTSNAPLDAIAFRGAMSRLGAAVNLVTTNGPGGFGGFAATAVCSVTDSPPTLLVCIQRASSAYAAVAANRVLCVNTLDLAHQGLAALFGGKTPTLEREAAAEWQCLATGAPVLPDARVAFDCRIASQWTVGTHDVLVCEVQAIAVAESRGAGLLYIDRMYATIAPIEVE